MSATREIKRRIRSINNTKKITKAMELVSAVKMRKSVNRVLASRQYANASWQILQNLSLKIDPRRHPLLSPKPNPKTAAAVLISANRGLCGSFSNNIFGIALKLAKTHHSINFVTLGKKGRDSLLKAGLSLAADFPKDDITTDILKIIPLVRLIIDDYLAGKYDQINLVYMDFVSSLVQKPIIKTLLPLETGPLPELDDDLSRYEEYLFEPDPETLLNDLVPRLLEVQIYQAVLESEASEHSARMLSMRNASDAASEIVGDLTLTYNQARQASITREIAEISAGKIALEN